MTPSVRSQIPGALIFVGAGLFGAYRLLHWFITGEVWVDFRSRGEPSDYRLITFDDYPVSFLFEFFINGLFATAGIAGAISLARWMHSWWIRADDGHESTGEAGSRGSHGMKRPHCKRGAEKKEEDRST
ncbi:hypothetical protein AB7783_20045 [Tardiphaga sp. 172_B4_N1_3]|uniref:hypothetical protein n=1 Tax=Tardiphaga sp. 172_B4_N1_3 TaxID=3240787 RepID=UPI003F8A11D7